MCSHLHWTNTEILKLNARSEQNWISLILIAPLSWKINLSIKNFFDIILRQSISHLLQNREKYQILKMYKPAFHLFIFIFVNLEGTVIFLIKRSSSIGFHFCDTSCLLSTHRVSIQTDSTMRINLIFSMYASALVRFLISLNKGVKTKKQDKLEELLHDNKPLVRDPLL